MDERRLNKANSKFMASENELWLPPLSHEDQEKVNRFRKKRRKERSVQGDSTGRTLWDWLNLFGVLAIPFVVTILGLYFTQQITQQQAQLSNTANQQQHQTDLQIAEDQQRETTLKTYLDDMSDLLLNHHLRNSKPGDEVSEVARERTLTTLRRLDAPRNKILLQFLQDAQLIGLKNGVENTVVDLSNADLSGDDLRGANLLGVELNTDNLNNANLSKTILRNANLSGADLSGADLSGTDLQYASLFKAYLKGTNLSGDYMSYADLTWANLNGADLSKADLVNVHFDNADLSETNLSGADLYGAYFRYNDLRRADLSGADLSGADLRQAKITQKQLAGVRSLAGATMPDGSIHP